MRVQIYELLIKAAFRADAGALHLFAIWQKSIRFAVG